MKIVELKTESQFSKLYPLIKQLNPDMPKKQFDGLLKDMRKRGYRCIAMEDKDDYLGICGFWLGKKFWCQAFLEIDNLVVLEGIRGKGIGQKLLAWIEKEAKRAKCNLIEFPVYTHNHAAHRFYFRHGYIIEGYCFTKRLKK